MNVEDAFRLIPDNPEDEKNNPYQIVEAAIISKRKEKLTRAYIIADPPGSITEKIRKQVRSSLEKSGKITSFKKPKKEDCIEMDYDDYEECNESMEEMHERSIEEMEDDGVTESLLKTYIKFINDLIEPVGFTASVDECEQSGWERDEFGHSEFVIYIDISKKGKK